jgi:choice-of-anchor C domain-containing protein
MKIEKATILVFVAVTLIFGLPTNANANLIVNGSFEDGPEPGDVIALPDGSDAIVGWEVSGDGIDYVGTCWVASEGDVSLDLDPSAGFGGIKQTFTTTPGGLYSVTFDMAGNPYRELGDPPIKYMGVSAAGQSDDFAFDTTGKSFPSNMGWVTYEWQFTANDTSTTLELFSLDTFEDGYSGYCGPALDNVSVSVVHTPEPATLSLLGLGSLLWLRRRRA